MSDNVWDEPETQEWARRVVGDLVPKISRSHYVISLVTPTETDVKFAVEIGFAVMMDKPIIAIVTPGTPVPNKLVLIADAIIEHDLFDHAGVARKLQETIADLES